MSTSKDDYKWEAIPSDYGTWYVVKKQRVIAHDMTMEEACRVAVGLNMVLSKIGDV